MRISSGFDLAFPSWPQVPWADCGRTSDVYARQQVGTRLDQARFRHQSFDLVELVRTIGREVLRAAAPLRRPCLPREYTALLARHPELRIEGEDDARPERLLLVTGPVVDRHADAVCERLAGVEQRLDGVGNDGRVQRVRSTIGRSFCGNLLTDFGPRFSRRDQVEELQMVVDHEAIQLALPRLVSSR